MIENTQRDLNIALMNELAMVFHQMDIDTRDVLAGSATKWNSCRFSLGWSAATASVSIPIT